MLPFFAAMMPVIILFCGLSLDVGVLQLHKLQLQAAADSAAQAAELEVERNTGAAAVGAEAYNQAAVSGYTNGANGVTVAVFQQPNYGEFSGFYDGVQVTISQQVRTLFLGSFNGGMTTVSAQASILVPPCAYMMGNANLQTYPTQLASAGVYPVCPIYGGSGTTVDAFSVLQAMAVNVSGPPSASGTGGGYISPTPRFRVNAMLDPLAGIAAPLFSGCNYTNFSRTSGTTAVTPGTFCNGLNLSNATLNMAPGLYIITGASNWQHNAVINGNGVTIYLTQGGGAGFGGLQFNNSTLNLSAPVDNSAGGIPTILFFGDRSWAHTSTQDLSCYASSVHGDGIWYMTGTGIYNWGCAISAPNYLVYVADNMYINTTTLHFAENFSSIPTGNPLRPLGGLVQ